MSRKQQKTEKETMIPDMGKEGKTTRFSKKIVVCSVTAIILFFVAETYLLNNTSQSYPDVFIASWFTFWGVELFNLARIKINEDKLATRENVYTEVSERLSSKIEGESEDREKAVG